MRGMSRRHWWGKAEETDRKGTRREERKGEERKGKAEEKIERMGLKKKMTSTGREAKG